MRAILAFLCLLSSAAVAVPVVSAQSPAPVAVSWICDNAWARAAGELTSVRPAPLAPSAGVSEPLDEAVRSCASLAEWQAAAAAYPAALSGEDAMEVLKDRCADPAAGLDRFATCASLVIALATPVPTPTAAPLPSPSASALPSPSPEATDRKRHRRKH